MKSSFTKHLLILVNFSGPILNCASYRGRLSLCAVCPCEMELSFVHLAARCAITYWVHLFRHQLFAWVCFSKSYRRYDEGEENVS